MGYIYKIINKKNGKIYIGKTLREDSWYFGSGILIRYAIRKYGKDSFTKEVIEECTDDILLEREIFWISYYNSTDRKIGYNISLGDDGGSHYWDTLTEEEKELHRKKISQSRKGSRHTKERKKIQSRKMKEKWKTTPDVYKNRKPKPNKSYILVKGKQIYRVGNLKEFSKRHGLDRTWLVSLSTGKKFTPNNGFYCIKDVGQDKGSIFNEIQEIKNKSTERYNAWMQKTKNKEKIKCEHCNKETIKPNYKRWHGSNCSGKKM